MLIKLNNNWRFRTQIRAICSFILSAATFWLYVQNGIIWLLFLSIIFSIFTAIPLLLIQRCNPPLVLNRNEFTLRAIQQRNISTKDVNSIIYRPEKKLLGLVLTSGKIITIPWKLIDDPSSAYKALQAHNFDTTFSKSLK